MNKLVLPKQNAGKIVVDGILPYIVQEYNNGNKQIPSSVFRDEMKRITGVTDNSAAVKQDEMLRYFGLVSKDFVNKTTSITARGLKYYNAIQRSDEKAQLDYIAESIIDDIFGIGAEYEGGNKAIFSSNSVLEAPRLFVKAIVKFNGVTSNQFTFLIRDIVRNKHSFSDACRKLSDLESMDVDINTQELDENTVKFNDAKIHVFLENIGFVYKDNEEKYQLNEYVEKIYGNIFSQINIFNREVTTKQYKNPDLINVAMDEYNTADVDCSNGYQNTVQESIGYNDENEIERQNNRNPETGSQATSSRPKTNAKLGKTKLEQADFKCEINPAHNTFETKGKNEKKSHQYMESHHFIPMKAQKDFKGINLDRMENLVCLCPNCHRQMHYGTIEAKKEILKEIYAKKYYDLYKKINKKITEEELFEKYFK